jgi:hypothetical protein
MPGQASPPTDFDAYHKWLGIPPAEQPPHHYRLLGLALFESDPEVIAAAADRQMAHVKSFAAGRNGAASQALLNELARARVTLLNQRQKAEYDVRLDAAHGAAARGPHADGMGQAPAEPPFAPPADATADALAASSAGLAAAQIFKARRKSASPAAVGLVLAGMAGFVALTLMVGRGGGEKGTAVEPTVVGATPTGRTTPPREPAADAEPAAETTAGAGEIPTGETTPDAAAIKPRAPRAPNPAAAPPRPAGGNAGSPSPAAPGRRDAPRAAVERESPAPAYAIDIDLRGRSQKWPLDDAASARFQVLGVRGSGAQVELDPADGVFDETSKVKIIVKGARDIVLIVDLRRPDPQSAAFFVEYAYVNSEGKPQPLTLERLDDVVRRIVAEGEGHVAELDALKKFRDAAKGKKGYDVAAMDATINAKQEYVDGLRTLRDEAEALRTLAAQLDKECAIEIARVE